MQVLANKMTNEWVPVLSALAPSAGAYMNEVGFSTRDYGIGFHLLTLKRPILSSRIGSRVFTPLITMPCSK